MYIIRLHPGKKDTQEPHSVDEVYYVIEGSGFIKLNGKDHEIRPGTCILFLQKLTTGSMGIARPCNILCVRWQKLNRSRFSCGNGYRQEDGKQII